MEINFAAHKKKLYSLLLSDYIIQLRKKCSQLCRRCQCARDHKEVRAAVADIFYQQTYKRLKATIRTSKKVNLRKLCNEGDKELFKKSCKMVEIQSIVYHKLRIRFTE